MSYKLIKQFRELRRSCRLSSHAADLFLVLLGEHNKARGRNPFTVRTQDIIDETGMSRPTLIKAQKELISIGLFDIQTSNNPKLGSSYTLRVVNDIDNSTQSVVKEIYNYIDLLVKEIYNLNHLLVNDIYNYPPVVKEIYNSTPSTNPVVNEIDNSTKRKIPPIPPIKEKYIPLEGERVGEAHTPAPPRTREGLEFYAEIMNEESLWREDAIRACSGVEDAVPELVASIIRIWEACNPEFLNESNRKKKLLGWLRVEAENLRKTRSSITAIPISERKQRFLEEMKAIRGGAEDSQSYDRKTLNAFFRYYTQPTPDGVLLAFETKPYWDTKTRLKQWIQREQRHNRP